MTSTLHSPSALKPETAPLPNALLHPRQCTRSLQRFPNLVHSLCAHAPGMILHKFGLDRYRVSLVCSDLAVVHP